MVMLFTSPYGRGRRAAPGEGLFSLDPTVTPHPNCFAIRPLPKGEVKQGIPVLRSIAGIALFPPRITAVVIAADLPVARRMAFKEFDALQPLRALPEIQMRQHQPHRAAMFLLQRRA